MVCKHDYMLWSKDGGQPLGKDNALINVQHVQPKAKELDVSAFVPEGTGKDKGKKGKSAKSPREAMFLAKLDGPIRWPIKFLRATVQDSMIAADSAAQESDISSATGSGSGSSAASNSRA